MVPAQSTRRETATPPAESWRWRSVWQVRRRRSACGSCCHWCRPSGWRCSPRATLPSCASAASAACGGGGGGGSRRAAAPPTQPPPARPNGGSTAATSAAGGCTSMWVCSSRAACRRRDFRARQPELGGADRACELRPQGARLLRRLAGRGQSGARPRAHRRPRHGRVRRPPGHPAALAGSRASGAGRGRSRARLVRTRRPHLLAAHSARARRAV